MLRISMILGYMLSPGCREMDCFLFFAVVTGFEVGVGWRVCPLPTTNRVINGTWGRATI